MSLPNDTVPDPHADPLVASLLSAAAAAEAAGCPDAELLGLYADRDLDADAAARVETHVHGCARCQAIVAACVRALPERSGGDATAGAGGGFAAWFAGWRWLVPAASLTAVALVAVWIGREPADQVAESARFGEERDTGGDVFARSEAFVEGQPRNQALLQGSRQAEAPTAPSSAATREATARAVAPPASTAPGRSADAPSSPPTASARAIGRAAGGGTRARDEAMAVAERTTDVRPKAADQAADREARQEAPVGAAAKSAVTVTAENQAARPQEAAAPPSSPAAAPTTRRQVSEALGANDVTVTLSVWRARDGRVERTRDNGTTWQPVTTPAGITVIAVASPSPDVCWAIGTDAVLKTTDGTTWVRTARPASEPLSGVGATSASEASVFTASGALFGTTDGGRTWTPAR